MKAEKLETILEELHDKVDGIKIDQAITNKGIVDINRRLDVSNGRLAKHDEEIAKNTLKLESLKLVKTLMYGLVATILLSFVGALISLVIVKVK